MKIIEISSILSSLTFAPTFNGILYFNNKFYKFHKETTQTEILEFKTRNSQLITESDILSELTIFELYDLYNRLDSGLNTMDDDIKSFMISLRRNDSLDKLL